MPLLEEAVETVTARQISMFLSLRMMLRAEGDFVCGRVAEARERAARAVAIAQARQEPGWEAWGLKLLGDIHAHEPGEPARADEAYRHALVLAEQGGMRPLAAHCHLGLGKLYGKTGRREQAHGRGPR